MVGVWIFWLACLFTHILERNIDLFMESKYSLIIGIASSQENFERRNLLRNTWLKPLSSSNKVAYYFLVGKYSCLVPPEDRLFFEECVDWSSDFYNLTRSWDSSFSIGMEESDQTAINLSTKGQPVSEFIFISAFDISLVAVGILSSLIEDNKDPLLVKIYSEKNAIVSTTIFSQASMSDDSTTWVSVGPLFLPKGFEGRIRIEGAYGTLFLNSTECYRRKDEDSPFVARVLHPTSRDVCLLTGFKYVLNDPKRFKEFVEKRPIRRENWRKNVSLLNRRLDEEISRFNDILTLNIIDVYRNLPLKILAFFNWITNNKVFEYVLKTDDDTIVNIKYVMREIEHTMKHEKVWDLWSCLRSGWPVNDIGKWREYNYVSKTYPEFPTGSGYVLRNSMVSYLSKNDHLLYKHFQGEDVSVGIWLSPVLPIKHSGKFCHWACDNLYRKFSCNVANLDVSEFNRYWNYLNTG